MAAVLCAGCGSLRPRAGFAEDLRVTRRGGKVEIRFAARTATDAAVAVIDPDGRVVRHLAAGTLGNVQHAPAPFAKGLSQRLVWDGRDDDGNPAPGGCRVQVRLGTRAEFDRLIEWDRPSVLRRGIVGLTAGPDGTLYSLQGGCFVARSGSPELVAFSRDGKYLRTLAPPPATALRGRPGVTVARSKLTAELLPRGDGANLLPGMQGVRRQTIQVRNGRMLMVMFRAVPLDRSKKSRRCILSVGLDGRLQGAPGGRPFGPALPGYTTRSPAMYLTATEKGEVVYLAGLRHDKKEKLHAVLSARWSDDELRPFFGKLCEKGTDAAHLDDPRGLAVDARGQLLVCDFGNDRIQVVSPAGTLIKSLSVAGPEQVVVHPKTGAVYVLSVLDKGRSNYGADGPSWDKYKKKALVKFDGVDGWRKAASIHLPEREKHMHDPGPILALDAAAEPILWISCVGRADPTDYLWKVVDRGGKLERVETPLPRYRWPFGSGRAAIAADPARDEVYFGGRGVRGSAAVYRFSGRTGRLGELKAVGRDIATSRVFRGELTSKPKPGGKPLLPTDHPQVVGLAVDRQGRLYVRLMPAYSGLQNWIRRYGRAGNRVPFKAGAQIVCAQPSHGYHPGSFTVAPNGDLYVVELAPGKKHRAKDEHNVLNIYGPDGKLKEEEAIPWLTSGVWGPKLDRDGNLYFTEAVIPRTALRPGPVVGQMRARTRGSLVRFKPSGGRQVFGAGPYLLRKHERSFPPAEFKGLDWLYYGVSPVAFGHCICSAAMFDLDRFGRAVVPDARDYCAKIIDPAGNFVAAFGGYGNRDSRGRGSAAPVPGIPLGSPGAIAVTDAAVYIYDPPNMRVVRVRLTHGAEQTVAVP